jgi:uncharacterized protein RhaS with RHS repeats
LTGAPTPTRPWSTNPSGTTNYSFDANGNLTQAGSRTYAYDRARRMKSTSDGNTTVTYSYDGDGKRLSASSGAQAGSAGQSALGASLGGWAELVPGAIGSQLCDSSSQTPTSK